MGGPYFCLSLSIYMIQSNSYSCEDQQSLLIIIQSKCLLHGTPILAHPTFIHLVGHTAATIEHDQWLDKESFLWIAYG